MYLPAAPDMPATAISNEELLRLFGAWGQCGKVALRRSLAMLPEIVRRGLYRKFAASRYEFAFMKTGATRDVVDRVLRLHEHIGHMPELWHLLATGEEGWAKLEIVAPVATPETAAWWAEQLRKCTAAELREFVRRHQEQRPQQRAAQPGLFPSGGHGRPAPARSGRPASGIRPASGEALGSEPESLGELPRTAAHGPDPYRPRAVTIYLTPEDEDLLRAWQTRVRQTLGQVVSLGEVVGRLLRGEWPRASEPTRHPGGQFAPGNGSAGGAQDDMAPSLETDAVAPPGSGTVPSRDGCVQRAELQADPIPDLAPKRIEVRIRPVGLPGDWAGRLCGVLPAGIAAAFKDGETIAMEDLYLEAIEAARRHKGERIPFAVRKFAALRAGLRCETGGCQNAMYDLDHQCPRSEGGDHHPDNIRARCRACHRMRHKALFADTVAGVVVLPGSPERSTPADRAFQAAVARAVAGSG
jgi:hypothetical protein